MDTATATDNAPEEEDSLEKMECAHCGTDIDDSDAMGIQESDGTWVDVCQGCYYDHVTKCELCGNEELMPSEVSRFIVVKTELAEHIPGIYAIRRRPFILGCMIGSDSLMSHAVLFVDRLPRPDRTFNISGHICKRCSRPYRIAFRARYPKRCFQRWDTPEILERARLRAVIRAHPELLFDLECDRDAYAWKETRRWLNLPDIYPTYHEWLFLEHKGVKVFYVYKDSDSGWLTLRPEPEFRTTYKAPAFDATALPTWQPSLPFERRLYQSPASKDADVRRALIAAIDQGLLTQEGVQHPVTA